MLHTLPTNISINDDGDEDNSVKFLFIYVLTPQRPITKLARAKKRNRIKIQKQRNLCRTSNI